MPSGFPGGIFYVAPFQFSPDCRVIVEPRTRKIIKIID
jgi:hypothetical protein